MSPNAASSAVSGGPSKWEKFTGNVRSRLRKFLAGVKRADTTSKFSGDLLVAWKAPELSEMIRNAFARRLAVASTLGFCLVI